MKRTKMFAIRSIVLYAALSFLSASRAATVTWSLMPTGASSGDAANITALSSFMPAGYDTQIIAAMNTWSKVANVQFVQVPDTGPNGATVRIGGHAFTVEPREYGHAYFPFPTNVGPVASDIHFDTNDTWVIGNSGITVGSTSNDPYTVALHELGHAVFGMQHTTGAISVMNSPFTSGQFYSGLLPTDVAAAQAAYGVAPGYVAPPATNATLNILSTSKINFTVSINGNNPIPLSTPVSGTLSTYISQNLGVATGVEFNDANLGLQSMTGTTTVGSPPFAVPVTGNMTNTAGWLFGPNLKSVDGNGHFDSGNLLFGLINGSISTTSPSPSLTLPNYSLFTHPLSMGTQAGVANGTVSLTPSGNPATRNVSLTLPLQNSITVDASLLKTDLAPGQAVVTISMNGTINASGTLAVPEPATWVLALCGAAGLALFARRHRQQRHQ